MKKALKNNASRRAAVRREKRDILSAEVRGTIILPTLSAPDGARVNDIHFALCTKRVYSLFCVRSRRNVMEHTYNVNRGYDCIMHGAVLK